eukprot:1160485-Pelagomonas_calceolata.AAC.3
MLCKEKAGKKHTVISNRASTERAHAAYKFQSTGLETIKASRQAGISCRITVIAHFLFLKQDGYTQAVGWGCECTGLALLHVAALGLSERCWLSCSTQRMSGADTVSGPASPG